MSRVSSYLDAADADCQRHFDNGASGSGYAASHKGNAPGRQVGAAGQHVAGRPIEGKVGPDIYACAAGRAHDSLVQAGHPRHQALDCPARVSACTAPLII